MKLTLNECICFYRKRKERENRVNFKDDVGNIVRKKKIYAWLKDQT